MRHFFLVVVIAASITLWYQYFVPPSVATILMVKFHMSFRFYVATVVLAQLAGVAAAITGHITDRIGRTWVVIIGLGVVALLQLLAIPHAGDKTEFTIAIVAVGLAEGIILVATPALVRDFTPQLGRASAMGFWTLGPVAGLLVATLLASHTLGATSGDWQREFIISGCVGLVVFGVSLLFLRELSPQLRDQLMVSQRDRVLVELRAKGIDVASALKKPWRQMLRFDVVVSALAVNVMLVLFYTASGFFPIFFVTVFPRATGWSSLPQANAIAVWMWAANCVALVVFGILSDIVRVRKPFMIAGALGMLAFIPVLISHAGHVSSGYYTIVWITSIIFTFQAMAYSTWMASFTETCEAHNPALIATGLSIWAGLLRFTAAVALFVMPYLIISTGTATDNSYVTVSPSTAAAINTIVHGKVPYPWSPYATGNLTEIVNIGTPAQVIQHRYPQQVGIAMAHPADWTAAGRLSQAQLLSPAHAPLLARLEKDVQGFPYARVHGTVNTLLWMNQVKPDLQFLSKYQGKLLRSQAALRAAPHEWQHWLWVDLACVLFFIPFVFVMKGRWSPRKARQDEREHERFVQDEVARLHATEQDDSTAS